MYKYFYLLCNTFAHVAQPHPAARCEAAASGSAATIMMMMCKLAVGRLISTLAQAQSESQAQAQRQTEARNCATANCNWAGCGCCRLCMVCACLLPHALVASWQLPVAARAVARRRPNALSHAIDSIPTAIKTAAASQ